MSPGMTGGCEPPSAGTGNLRAGAINAELALGLDISLSGINAFRMRTTYKSLIMALNCSFCGSPEV